MGGSRGEEAAEEGREAAQGVHARSHVCPGYDLLLFFCFLYSLFLTPVGFLCVFSF